MNLYTRDYKLEPSKQEMEEYDKILAKEIDGRHLGRVNLHYSYPEAVRHHNSLFPNNHIELYDWKKNGISKTLTDQFEKLVHDKDTNEQKILRFINHTPAYHIIGSTLIYKTFGHHDAYIFPEFPIGDGLYRADYLLIGSGSGGYQFLYVELEAPNKNSTLNNGHEGLNTRLGINQISDWKYSISSNYDLITKELIKLCLNEEQLPDEFRKFDPTRMHYMVITGLRKDCNETAYRERRARAMENNIEIFHYDNLVDWANQLEERLTF